MRKQIFINLPVRDLDKTIKFFTHLGFKFDPKFTDQNAACMIIGDNIFAMLLVDKFFKMFTKKEITDTTKNTEVINAIAVDNREKVNEMVNKAVKVGGIEYREPQEYGWMYGRGFQDIDGHLWEVFHMDESKRPEEMKNKK